MKTLFYIFAICVCFGFAAEPAYIKAIEGSEKTGKPILVEFYAKWCPPCLEMEKTVFKDPAVKKELSNFHFIRIDTDKNEPFFCEGQTLRTSDCIRLWEVEGLPAFGIMDINGRLKYLTVGSFEKSTFLVFLKAVRAK
ncbi:MAG: thioredoxin family protein [Fibromonadaceae bacterium]|jgi:thioredoxin-related protein|nr:thioredoxin family protein [Fibromonadaceae bacterium]